MCTAFPWGVTLSQCAGTGQAHQGKQTVSVSNSRCASCVRALHRYGTAVLQQSVHAALPHRAYSWKSDRSEHA
jgi:hypothetical protein